MKQLIFFILVMILIPSGAAFGQVLETEIKVSRPDFSGKWSIDIAKSRFSSKKGRPFEKDLIFFIVTINQGARHIKVKMNIRGEDTGNEKLEYDLRIDGRPQKFEQGFSTTKWHDKKLVVQFFDAPNETLFEEYKELVSEMHIDLLSDNTLQIVGKLVEGKWAYKPNARPNVIDEQYSDYMVFSRVKN